MQAQAVKKLGFIRRHQRSKAGRFTRLGVIGVDRAYHLRHGLDNGHALQHSAHFFQGGGRRQAIQPQGVRRLHHGFTVALRQGFNQAKHIRAVHRTQHLAYGGFVQLAAAKSDGLVRQ
ncbi:hypothetical protein D3C71_1458680 [compost metagenome]